MAEVISEQQPRIKFKLTRLGGPTLALSLDTPGLQARCRYTLDWVDVLLRCSSKSFLSDGFHTLTAILLGLGL